MFRFPPLATGAKAGSSRSPLIRNVGASGCSIDGLFRTLKALEQRAGRQLVPSGLVDFRARMGRFAR